MHYTFINEYLFYRTYFNKKFSPPKPSLVARSFVG